MCVLFLAGTNTIHQFDLYFAISFFFCLGASTLPTIIFTCASQIHNRASLCTIQCYLWPVVAPFSLGPRLGLRAGCGQNVTLLSLVALHFNLLMWPNLLILPALHYPQKRYLLFLLILQSTWNMKWLILSSLMLVYFFAIGGRFCT